MVLTNRLKGIIVENGISQKELSEKIGISDKTFYSKMKKGVFKSNEMQMMIDILKIQNPADIFFHKK